MTINNGLVQHKKALFLEEYKDIFCEVCDFNYRKNYGERGDGYIECHHTRPLSDGARETCPEDLILVCASCHRMIHRKEPWLEIDELKDIVKARPYY